MDINQNNIKANKQILLSSDNNSNNNIKFDGISARIEFIKLLLKGNNLNPMINFDLCDTEHVENRTDGFDIRTIMTKKNMDFNYIVNYLSNIKNKCHVFGINFEP